MNIRQTVEKAKCGNQKALQKLLKLSREDIRFTCETLCGDPATASSFAAETEKEIVFLLGSLTVPEQYMIWARQTAAVICLRQTNALIIPKAENTDDDHQNITVVIHLPQRYLNDADKLSALNERFYYSTDTVQYRLLFLYFFVRFPAVKLAGLLNCTEKDIAAVLNNACQKAENAAAAFVKENREFPDSNEVSLFEIFDRTANTKKENKTFFSEFSVQAANKKSAGEFLKSRKNKIILAVSALLLFSVAFVAALSAGLNFNNQSLNEQYYEDGMDYDEVMDYNILCQTLNYTYIPYQESGLNTGGSDEYIESNYVTLVQVLVESYGAGELNRESSSVFIDSSNDLYNASGKRKIQCEIYDVTVGGAVYEQPNPRYLYNILMPGKIALNRLSIDLIFGDLDDRFVEMDYALEKPVNVGLVWTTEEAAVTGNIVRLGDYYYYLLDAECREIAGSAAEGYKTARSTLYMICLSPEHYNDDSYMNEEFSGKFSYGYDTEDKNYEPGLDDVSIDINTQDNTDSDKPGYFSKVSIDMSCSVDPLSSVDISSDLLIFASHICFYYSDSDTTLRINPIVTRSGL